MQREGYTQRRAGVLAALAAEIYADRSRKGSVDVRALGVIELVNAWPDMYTTSSCSGRTSVFAEPTEETRLASKKGGEWVYASHDPPEEEEVLAALHDRCGSGAQLVFRFEPFLLHVECDGMAAANRLLTAARAVGFRESGAWQGSTLNTRIMVGIRCSLRLEVPVADAGQMLVSDDYIRFLVQLARHKFELNTTRIARLEAQLREWGAPPPELPPTTTSLSPPPPVPPADGTQPTSSRGSDSRVVVSTAAGAAVTAAAPAQPRRRMRGVPSELTTPLQDLKARQVAVLQRLAALTARVQHARPEVVVPSPRPAAAAPATEQCWVLYLPARAAKPVKDALRGAGWLDQRRKGGDPARVGLAAPQAASAPPASVPMVVLPLLPAAVAPLQQVAAGQVRADVPGAVVDAIRGGARLAQVVTRVNGKVVEATPQERMRVGVAAALSVAGVPTATLRALLDDLPGKWETLGPDLSLVQGECMRHAAWASLRPPTLNRVYQAIASALGVTRLARQAPIADTGTRDSQAALLLGDDGWVRHTEYGVTFVLDVRRCMFSSGNVTERCRMGALQAAGETVVDMFTGIGYYTLPLLVRAGVAKVYACEWNPAALDCLSRGLDANGVTARCEVRGGDCRQVAPQGVAHRVLLGLLPHSGIAWPAAVAALRPDTGGWLHVHNNVLDSEEAQWLANMVSELQRLCASTAGRSGWTVHVQHVEHVKSYAPRVNHIVADVWVGPGAPRLPSAAV